ncbi:MAG: hypothetical protein K2V38_16210 [Gemmataceae bacterium]|nr:hypothetical protein [Gemmataceae bacterium]
MSRSILRVGCAFALGLGLAALPVLAEDPKPKDDAPKAPAKSDKPDFSGYVFVADVVGEVVKADDKALTLRVTWFVPVQKNGGNQRPNLGGNNRNFRNPFQQNMRQPQVQWKEEHHDYTIEFLPQSQVRTKTLAPKIDDDGKKVARTQKELDELRAPAGYPGYAASKTDLTPATIAEVYLIRDKSIPAAKAGEDDLRVKYAVILGTDPNPPKGIGKTEPKAPPKKN